MNVKLPACVPMVDVSTWMVPTSVSVTQAIDSLQISRSATISMSVQKTGNYATMDSVSTHKAAIDVNVILAFCYHQMALSATTMMSVAELRCVPTDAVKT